MSMLDLALQCAARGWYVFPCRGKIPIHEGGYKNAAVDADTIQRLWASNPNANPAIVPGASGFTALDIDHGLGDEESLRAFMQARGLPPTFAVRTGKRPEFRVQLYYSGCAGESLNGWKDGEFGGDLRATWGHVMAPGAIHPESGEAYTILWDIPLAPVPAWVRGLRSSIKERVKDDGGPITENRNSTLTSIAGKLRNAGLGHDALEAALLATNAKRCAPPLDDEEVCRIADNARKWPLPDGAQATLGKPADWRTLFHTREEVLQCPPPTFLIDQFLAREAICAIAAPVAQRKSLIALNIARSLCTGEPLFGSLRVMNRPSRVLYLCPEMGLVSLSDRIRRIGLGSCLGETLFLRSMNMRTLELLDIPDAALDGAVLIIDTAIRFLKGDENSSEDMQVFSDTLFAIQRRQGPAGAIVALYHSPKATKDASELTLENCLRGSGELGAAITDAHGTRLQDPSAPYESLSFIRHIKCRDYKGLDGFEVSGDRETGILRTVGDPFATKATLKLGTGGTKANRDGKDEAARAIIRAHPGLTVAALIDKLEEAGIDRKKTWVTEARMEAARTGARRASA